jgi:prepilin-type N-terminal cleavage/methylation domain-containing protein
MKHNIKSRKGFTLVEMLGVLAIIAILISVISVGVLAAINRARIVATISNFKNLETAALSYIALNESSGKLPLTKSGTLGTVASTTGTGALSTIALADQGSLHLETVFLAAGTLEKYPNWRVGNDPLQNGIVLANERGWNRKINRWSTQSADGIALTGTNNWLPFCRAECALSGTAVTPGTYNANGTMDNAGLVNFKLDGSTSLPINARVAYVVLPGLTPKDAEKLSEEINGSLNDITLRGAAPVYEQTRGRFVTSGSSIADPVGGLVGYYLLGDF